METYERRVARLQDFYDRRVVSWAEVQHGIDAMLCAVRLNCSPDVTEAIEAEFAQLLAQFTTPTDGKEDAQ